MEDSIAVLDALGDPLRCIDFGQIVMYSSPVTNQVFIQNTSNQVLVLRVKITSNQRTFPAMIEPQSEVVVLSAQSVTPFTVTATPDANVTEDNPVTSKLLPTSFTKFQLKLDMTLSTPTPISSTSVSTDVNSSSDSICNPVACSIPIYLSLCESTMFIDTTLLEFDDCILHSVCSKDIQVWNRSECDMQFSIHTLKSESTIHNTDVFVLYNCTTECNVCENESIHVSGFSSIRIRLSISLTCLGYSKHTIIFTNLFNPGNVIPVDCYVGVITNTTSNSLVCIETEIGTLLYQGQSLILDNCYFHQTLRKRIYIRNNSEENIVLINVIPDSTSSLNVAFTIGQHVPDDTPLLNLLGRLGKDANDRLGKVTDDPSIISSIQNTTSSGGSAVDAPKVQVVEVEDIEVLNQWSTVYGNICYDPKSLNYWEQINIDNDDYEEDRWNVSLARKDKGSSKEEVSFIDEWRKTMSTSSSSDREFILKPRSRISITLSITPTPDQNTTNNSTVSNVNDGVLRTLASCFYILVKQQHNRPRSNSDSPRMFWWKGSTTYVPPIMHKYSFGCKTQCCLSMISVNQLSYNLGECLIGEYYAVDFNVYNNSELPALVYPYVNSDTLGIAQKELIIPPKEFKCIKIDYVAKLVNSDYSRVATLYNVFNIENSPKIEIKAKNIDPNQILSHGIFYKIFTRNARRQLQIYYDKAFYNIPNVRVISIKNIYQKPLDLLLKSMDLYEISIYTFTSNSHVVRNKFDLFESQLEDLRWGDSSAIKRSLSYPASEGKSFGRRSASSIDIQSDANVDALQSNESLSRSNAHKMNSTDVKSKMDDCIALFEKQGFPYDDAILLPQQTTNIHDNVSTVGNSVENSVLRIRKVKKCLKDFRETLTLPDYMINIDNVQCKLEVGETCDFIVVYEPRSHGEKEELDLRLKTKYIELSLPSATKATVAEHLERMGHKSTEPSDPTPLKSRLISIQAKVCRSEMVVSQKNVNFGRTTVGEHTSWSVVISNLSAIPLMYCITKSGSIASGFLFFSSGRHREISPHSMHQIEIEFKPTLPGPFEEELRIHNILNPQNSQSIVIKANVTKSESFSVRVINESSSDAESYNLGNVVVGKYSQTLSFCVNNNTSKTRQLIVDASHLDVVALSSIHAEAYNVQVEELSTVCTLNCNFTESISETIARKNRISTDEREKLEDKLEFYHQKLKIAKRKNREEKYVKYEKKIASTQAYLSGECDLLEGDKDSDEEKESAKENVAAFDKHGSTEFAGIAGSNAASSELLLLEDADGSSTLGSSTAAYHFKLAADTEVIVHIKFTFLPGASYFLWSGGLEFKGFLRIFECKNEDNVKLIRFHANLFSSQHSTITSDGSFTSFELENSTSTIGTPIALSGQSSPRNSSKSKSFSDCILFLAAVAQWCSYPTKQIYPRYRSMKLLGMSLKLTPSNLHRTMQGEFSVSSTASELGSLRISCYLNMKSDSILLEHTPYDPDEHGRIDFACAPEFEYEYNEEADYFPELNLNISSGCSKKFLVQWRPSVHIKKCMVIGAVCIELRLKHGLLSTLFIPFIGLVESKSIIQVEKYCHLGSLSVGTKKNSSVTINNKSETESLHYLIMVVSVAQSKSAVGKISISSSRTGVISPISSKIVEFNFTGIAIGKFEQQLWVGNLNDRFDQKRMTIRANVVVAESQLVLFPQVDFDDEGKSLHPVKFGLIQISPNSSINSPDFIYKLRMINISDKYLLVSALSNLKKQCYVFSDSQLSKPALLYKLSPLATSYLYIVLRPTSIINTSTDTGRDLIGGIRIIFASLEEGENRKSTELDSKDMEISAKSPDCMLTDEESDEYNKRNKMFERSIVFTACIGSSILKIHAIKSYLSGEADVHTLLQGTFVLENASLKFPLKYAYGENIHVVGRHWSPTKKPSDALLGIPSFYVVDDRRGDLYPGEKREILYFFTSEYKGGLFQQCLNVMNTSTGVESCIELSAFFKDAQISIYSYDSMNTSAAYLLKGENVECENHVWVSATSVTDITTCYIADNNEFESLLHFQITNNSLTSLSFSPVSNLPVHIVYSDVPTVSGTISERAYGSEAPLSVTRFGLMLCGEAAIIGAKQSLQCYIVCKEGTALQESILQSIDVSELRSGKRACVIGDIGILSNRSILDSSEDSANNTQKLLVTPLVGYFKLKINIAMPLLKVEPQVIDFGSVKSNKKSCAVFSVENNSAFALPVSINNMHPWITVMGDEKHEGGNVALLLPAHSQQSVSLQLEVPRLHENILFEEELVIVSIAQECSCSLKLLAKEPKEVISLCASTSTEMNIFKDSSGEKYCLLPDIQIPNSSTNVRSSSKSVNVPMLHCSIGLLNVAKENIRVRASVKMSPEIQQIFEFAFIHQNVELQTQILDILPDELADLCFSLQGVTDAIVTDAITQLACSYHDSLSLSTDPYRIGPIVFGITQLDFEYIDKQNDTSLPIDSQLLDLVGYVVAQPIISFSVDSVAFESEYTQSSHSYQLSTYTQTFTLFNASCNDIPYRIDSLACRRPGLQLLFNIPSSTSPNSNSTDAISCRYDTVDVSISPSSGVLEKHSSIEVQLVVIPGHTSGMDYCYKYDSSKDQSILAVIPLTVTNSFHLHHPPSVIEVKLHSTNEDILKHTKTKPVSEIKRYKQSPTDESSPPSPSVSLQSNIRLRGLAFSTASGRYEINMGQHSQKNESIEWLLRIENGSKHESCTYSISTESPTEDQKWITLGHSYAMIPCNTFSVVMMYFNRSCIGMYHTVVCIECQSVWIAYINVSFEVTTEPSKVVA